MSAFSTTHWIIFAVIVVVVAFGIYRAKKEFRDDGKAPPKE